MESNSVAKMLQVLSPTGSRSKDKSSVLMIAGETYLLVDLFEKIKSHKSILALVKNVDFGFVHYANLSFTYLGEDGRMESFSYGHADDVSGLVFVVDGNDVDHIGEAAAALMKLFVCPILRKLPLVVFAIKTCSQREMTQDEIRTWLNLNERIVEIRLLYDDPMVLDEVHDGLYWLIQRLKK